MVAKFETGSSLNQTLNYNEKKVQKRVAELLTAVNYPIDHPYLSFQQKLNRLENQAALNENVTRNSIHISLNFDPSEQLEKEKLIAIATTYMDKIGFGEQPYLLYQHFDAGHPHIHIVSVKVKADGKRIDTQNIGRNQSEKARKEIEIAFNLVRAEDSKVKEKYKLEPVNAQKVQYGKMETKRAINMVLRTVLDTYKYCSLPELNALLKLYNVAADRGSEDSRMYRHNGLMYRVLDEQGRKVGAPVKASQFFMKPTLQKLEANFKKNETLKNPHRARIKNVIDLALLKKPGQPLPELVKNLEKEGIATVIRQNDKGIIYGITYVDHQTKCIFNGSDLGKSYSAKAILERCGNSQSAGEKERIPAKEQLTGRYSREQEFAPGGASITDALLQQEFTGDTLPFDLKRKRKKKKKNITNR